MDDKEFDLAEYMTKGVEGIVKDAILATLQDPKESAFMARFARSCRKAAAKRASWEAKGEAVFKEAGDLGVSFILLPGGEPLMRRDVLDRAAASCSKEKSR